MIYAQPVHALGLFVGALRKVPLTPEGTHLVDRIEQSTVAMDSLFSAILDISRLDAGVIEAREEAFDIQPLLDRVCNDYEEEAKQKVDRSFAVPFGNDRYFRSGFDRTYPAELRIKRIRHTRLARSSSAVAATAKNTGRGLGYRSWHSLYDQEKFLKSIFN